MNQHPDLLRRLLRARDRIDAASDQDWPVPRLAKVSGVSPAHFARAFKQAFGLPPHRYLLTRRIERAAALLRDSDLSVTDIAFATGWSSLGSFSRTFHDIVGVTPLEMRAQGSTAAEGGGAMPLCIQRAARRPDLHIAVLEKRRRARAAKLGVEAAAATAAEEAP